MDRVYFATVIATDRQRLMALDGYGLDLFRQTARALSQRQVVLDAPPSTTDLAVLDETDQVDQTRHFTVEGALTLEDIGRLVDDGYEVLVRQNCAAPQTRSADTISAEQFLQQMGLDQQEG